MIKIKNKTVNIGSIEIKTVNIGSIEIDGVDTHDYPDFVDAFVSYAEFENGIELNEVELDQLTYQEGELMNTLSLESLNKY
tara:strand:- start:626 stop:868 length:243 start_codon:yes stop_codon:yes gene_type:complete